MTGMLQYLIDKPRLLYLQNWLPFIASAMLFYGNNELYLGIMMWVSFFCGVFITAWLKATLIFLKTDKKEFKEFENKVTKSNLFDKKLESVPFSMRFVPIFAVFLITYIASLLILIGNAGNNPIYLSLLFVMIATPLTSSLTTIFLRMMFRKTKISKS